MSRNKKVITDLDELLAIWKKQLDDLETWRAWAENSVSAGRYEQARKELRIVRHRLKLVRRTEKMYKRLEKKTNKEKN